MEIVKLVFQSKSKRYQFIRYCTVGTLAAGIHYGVYYLLQEYEMTNLNIAYTIGYVTSFICNFFLTSYFTFRSNPSLKRALGFGGSHLVNYLIHMGLFNLFLYLNVDQEIAPLCVLAVAVPANFLMLHFSARSITVKSSSVSSFRGSLVLHFFCRTQLMAFTLSL